MLYIYGDALPTSFFYVNMYYFKGVLKSKIQTVSLAVGTQCKTSYINPTVFNYSESTLYS